MSENTLKWNILHPQPRIIPNKVTEVESFIISHPKGKHIHIEIVDVSYGGTHDYWIMGDVAIQKDKIKDAKDFLKGIEGCSIYSEHEHALSIDLHPICKFHTSREADKGIPKLWEWANEYGGRDEKNPSSI